MPAPKKSPKFVKAYNNIDFLNSPSARTIRIMTEMIEPRERLRKHRIHNTVVFFGSARTLPRSEARKNIKALEAQMAKKKSVSAKLKRELVDAKNDLVMSHYYEDAVLLAEKLTKWFQTPSIKKQNFHVCTGGGPGIMEAANRGAYKAKGTSIGLNINLPMEQDANPYQTQEISSEFHYFFIRKFWFFYLSKAMIVFPGGFGTMDELFELLTLVQTQKTKKRIPIVLYGSKYWHEVVNFDAFVRWGMISKSDLKLFKIVDSVDDSFDYLTKEIIRNYANRSKKK